MKSENVFTEMNLLEKLESKLFTMIICVAKQA
jgi:hypothetical protein